MNLCNLRMLGHVGKIMNPMVRTSVATRKPRISKVSYCFSSVQIHICSIAWENLPLRWTPHHPGRQDHTRYRPQDEECLLVDSRLAYHPLPTLASCFHWRSSWAHEHIVCLGLELFCRSNRPHNWGRWQWEDHCDTDFEPTILQQCSTLLVWHKFHHYSCMRHRWVHNRISCRNH